MAFKSTAAPSKALYTPQTMRRIDATVSSWRFLPLIARRLKQLPVIFEELYGGDRR